MSRVFARFALPLVLFFTAAPALGETSNEPGEPPPKRGFGVKLAVGAAHQRLFSTSITGAEIALAFGGETKVGAFYGSIIPLFGVTGGGLSTARLTIGPSWEYPFERLRLGLSPQLSYIRIQRVTSGDAMVDFSAGAAVFGTFDVVRIDPITLTVGLRGAIDGLLRDSGEDSTGAIYGGTFSLGARY